MCFKTFVLTNFGEHSHENCNDLHNIRIYFLQRNLLAQKRTLFDLATIKISKIS